MYSSPAFKQYDDEFNLRSCFFEETPGTSSGIDSIDIIATSASKVYDQEPSPTVTIDGDGVGAAATAIVVNGKITSIRIDDPGVNYTTATAYITYLDEVDTTVALTVNIQNRYGVIRSYYINETTKVKTVLNPNAGEIDYILGKITLTNFDPVSIEDPLNEIKSQKIKRTANNSTQLCGVVSWLNRVQFWPSFILRSYMDLWSFDRHDYGVITHPHATYPHRQSR